jgi:hypothetical protein
MYIRGEFGRDPFGSSKLRRWLSDGKTSLNVPASIDADLEIACADPASPASSSIDDECDTLPTSSGTLDCEAFRECWDWRAYEIWSAIDSSSKSAEYTCDADISLIVSATLGCDRLMVGSSRTLEALALLDCPNPVSSSTTLP